MRLSDELILEFEDYKKLYFDNNTGIYANFNSEQLEAIKRYFRWRTRRRFKELCKNTTLETKPKKAQELSNIMGGATDWVYDGCVDTGTKGGGHCELGHALRYEHYAYSKSINKCIVFGVNCAADFFGIEPSKLRKINTVQADTLEDIKLIAFIKDTGRTKQFMSMYYNDLGNIIQMFKGELDSVFGSDWNKIIGEFLSNGLPLTIPMICKIEYVRNKMYIPKIEEVEQLESIKKIVGDDLGVINILKGSELHLLKSSCKYLANYSKDTTEYRRKCCSFVINQALEFDKSINVIYKYGVKDIEKFARSGSLSVMFVTTDNGDRIATVKERDILPEQSYIRHIKLLDNNKIEMLNAIGWGATGKQDLYSKTGVKNSEDELSKIEDSAGIIKKAIKWINSPEFKDDLRVLAEAAVKYRYLESAEDEIKQGTSIEDIMNFIMDNTDDSTNNWLIKASRDIIQRNRKFKGELSKKQEDVLLQTYRMLSKNIKSDVVKKAEMIIQNQYEPVVAKKYSFHLKVAKTVVNIKRASEKQEKIINEAYDGIVKNDNSVNDIPEEQLFVSGYSDDDIDEYEEYKAEIYDIPDIKVEEQISEYSSYNIPDGMPSIIEISQALGTGQFKYEPLYKEE